MVIIGTLGRLGTGKTLGGVIEAYRDHCLRREIFSNIWLSFPHIPIKEPRDFIRLQHGFCLGDELWSLLDNRRSMSKLSDIMTIIAIRSRKQDFDIFYTQQYLQIDVRLQFITDFWIKSAVVDDEGIICTKENKRIPEYLIQKVWDGDFNRLPERYIKCRRFLDMFKTNLDPYTLRASLTDEAMQEAFDEIYGDAPSTDKKEFEKIEEKAKRSGKRERLAEIA